MNLENYLSSISRPLKRLILLFIITLSIGFYTGINFVHFTTAGVPSGIAENYLGNEDNEDAEVMKFKKSKHQMLNIIHTHFLSMSLIFFVVGLLVYGCDIPTKFKSFLMVEPLLSVFATFGSIYFLWQGITWMTYITIISGTLMVVSYTLSVILIIRAVIK